MPRADTAIRIQRTPALKYIGASLVEERQLLTPSFPPGNSPFLPTKVGWKGSPWLSPAPCVGSHALLSPQGSKHTYPKGLGEAPALSSTSCCCPSPVSMFTLCHRDKAESCRNPKAPKSPELPQSTSCSQKQPPQELPCAPLSAAVCVKCVCVSECARACMSVQECISVCVQECESV